MTIPSPLSRDPVLRRARSPIAPLLVLLVAVALAPGNVAAQLAGGAARLLQQGVDGLGDVRETGDRFGSVLAWGDFDGDGFDDLVVGVPEEDVTGANQGIVQVVYGARGGPAPARADRVDRAELFGPSSVEVLDAMGRAVAAGDFDGDGFDDLAIGVPNDRVRDQSGAGSLLVLYGTASGLAGGVVEAWTQASSGVDGTPEPNDGFGEALAAGDFDGDGRDDLAIGVPRETFDPAEGLFAGAVNVLYGTAGGLGADRDQLLDRGGFAGQARAGGDGFGAALAVGDFDGDGRDDLAVGAPGADVAGLGNAGLAFTLLGSDLGLVPTGVVRRDALHCAPGVRDVVGAGDRLGAALAVGDFDGNGRDDLAVGIPGARVGAHPRAGQVDVLYSGRPGQDDCRRQGAPGAGDQPEDGESFGASLAAGDTDGDGRDDLAVGVPADRRGGSPAGSVFLYLGTPAGVAATAGPVLSQALPGVPDDPENGDAFGTAVALGDPDGDGRDDLAVGVPVESLVETASHGVVHVFFAAREALFADGFETGSIAAWGPGERP